MAESSPQQLIDEALKQIGRVRGCDRGRIRKSADRLKKRRDKIDEAAAAGLLAEVRASRDEKRRRREQAPKTSYPEILPISSRRQEIVRAIRENQVIVLSGETGSGKTTQIPKMCIEAGRGVDGLIGCTQPRRIAAMTVAARIAEEIGNEDLVGYKIRFHEKTSPKNYIRIMTDGMLLAEAQGHPSLNAYDTLIIDEAHERSLNIDVLLGMIRRLMDRRRNLKIIITSATLDTEKFSRHFGDAPIIEVSGRTYPVEIRYEEAAEDEAGLSLAERTALSVASLVKESRQGDILAFLPTEQDIRETMELCSRDFGDRLNILPLYARLPASEQKKAFVSGGKRKLVVATNVAETSLTIPGIRYVVDSGMARISRYNPGTQTHGLPVDPISRASADQRAGRCGRVENGICIRMYSEEDYMARPEFTAPEIRRTNLAEVILRLIDLGISDLESFPFVDPPDSAGIRDGLRTLREIGALLEPEAIGSKKRRDSNKRKLSADGRIMARLPLDPRLARVLMHADSESCLGDVLPIAAALSLPDPRERPKEKAGSADKAHKAFLNDQSDFIGWLNIWDGFRTYGRKGSYSSRLKHYCNENYLSFRRMKEWMDIHRQLALVMEDNGYRPKRLKEGPWIDKKGEFTDRYGAIHRSILSGFLSHIARHEEKGRYEATRNRTALIHPGSALHRSDAPWIMAAELVRTSKLYARSVASIDPDWLAGLATGLVSRNWKNPVWSRKAGAVMATEQLRLFGFLVSDDKRIPYATVKPEEARSIFIRSALVELDIPDLSPYGFLRANKKLRSRLETMEEKLRRRDLIAGEEAMSEFYAARLPKDVVDLGTLNSYLKNNRRDTLVMTEADLLTGLPTDSSLESFPDGVEVSGTRWKLSYTFDPESKQDGATLRIPAGRLSDLDIRQVDWMVPGLLRDKVEALMRSLPKAQRRKLIPIPQAVDDALGGMERVENDLPRALSEWLYRERGINIPPTAWDMHSLPEHLKMRYSLLDDSGREAAAGRDAQKLLSTEPKASSKGRANAYRKKHERIGLKQWPDEPLPESVTIPGGALLWPALEDREDSVALVFADNRIEAEAIHRKGQIRLGSLNWARQKRDLARSNLIAGEARIAASYLGGASKIEEALWEKAMAQTFGSRLIRNEAEWNTFLAEGGRQFAALGEDYLKKISAVMSAYGETRKTLNGLKAKSHRPVFVEERLKECETLVSPTFINEMEPAEWSALPRWLEAVVSRARKGAADPQKDSKATSAWLPLSERLDEIKDGLSPLASAEKVQAVKEASMMLRELYVALYAAGEVRPKGKVSESKMESLLNTIEMML